MGGHNGPFLSLLKKKSPQMLIKLQRVVVTSEVAGREKELEMNPGSYAFCEVL